MLFIFTVPFTWGSHFRAPSLTHINHLAAGHGKSFWVTTNLGDTEPRSFWRENIKLQKKKHLGTLLYSPAINLKIDFKDRKNKAYSWKEILNIKRPENRKVKMSSVFTENVTKGDGLKLWRFRLVIKQAFPSGWVKTEKTKNKNKKNGICDSMYTSTNGHT